MTYARREQIFSKDVIRITEFAELMDVDYKTASSMMVAIKETLIRNSGRVRIKTNGKLHVQDFIDYYKVDIRRYIPQKEERNDGEQQGASNSDTETMRG